MVPVRGVASGDDPSTDTEAARRQGVQEQKEVETGAQPSAVEGTESEEPPTEDTGLGDVDMKEEATDQEPMRSKFSQVIYTPGRERTILFRRERREEHYQHAVETGAKAGSSHHPLEILAEEMQALQEQDSMLLELQKAADSQMSSAGMRFFQRGGLLYQQ